MSRITRNLELFTICVALFATPLLLVAGYLVFGGLAAARFMIYDMPGDYSRGVAAAVLLLVLIQLWPIAAEHRRVLSLLWLVRTGTTLGLMLAYEAGYGLDAVSYYIVGTNLSEPLKFFEFGEGTKNITALVGLLSQVTESYSALKVIFSYLGLIAVYIFYRSAVICLGGENIAILYVLGLLPSLMFWTSILGKDPVVLLGIAIYCYGSVNLIVRQKISMLIYVAAGLLIASYIRIWLGVIFVTPLIVTYVMAGRTSALTKIPFLMIAIPGFLLTLQGFSERFSLETTEDLVQTTQYISTSWARGGSAQEIEGSFDSITSMLLFMPLGSFTALFRPLPFEILNPFGTMAGLENACILLLFVIGLARRGFGWIRQPVLLWAVSALLVWGAIYGFASYQNLGTAFRFRAQVAPILLLLGLFLTFAHRLQPQKDLRLKSWPAPPQQSDTLGTAAEQ